MDPQAAERPHCSPNGPFLSEPQDFTHSVRFSKFDRFELLMSLCGKWLRGFSRPGESLQFPNYSSQALQTWFFIDGWQTGHRLLVAICGSDD
jgi:hypothetical protein